MKIDKDIITEDEMFAKTNKIKLVDDVIYKVYGKLISHTGDEIKFEGANASAEDVDEGKKTNVESGVLNQCFAFGDKKSYPLYLKDILCGFKELQFFTDESMDCDGMVSLVEYREINTQSIPVLIFFKQGLEKEKW